jgi:cytochrome c oxidase subunit 2
MSSVSLLIVRWLARAVLASALLAGGPARGDAPRVIEISAKRFEFTPHELHLHKGETVMLRVTSSDVTHGLFQRALGLDLTLEPGKTVEATVTPKEAGRFHAICDNFCGAGHGNMHLDIIVE